MADLRFDAALNVFTGPNGAGKTSLLEAVHFLGRARSFRTADRRVLIRCGADEAEVAGVTAGADGPRRFGVRLGSTGIEIRVDGRTGAQPADLVEALPLQAIEADIGGLIRGPPDGRRRLLDWGVFHVKHDYLVRWRRFRQALLQRNAALRNGDPDAVLGAWEAELAATAGEVDDDRQAYVHELQAGVERLGEDLLGAKVAVRCLRGWAEGQNLAAVLRAGREGDRKSGYTRVGPHRADLQLEIQSQRARWMASRGEQKLLGAALILAQCDLAASRLGRRLALLVDEPAAELDREHLDRFLRVIGGISAQVFLAAITAEGLGLDQPCAMFHVEHGTPKALL